MMLPTRVVIEKNDRQSTIVIKNTGEATGNFTVELVDMKMTEAGMVVPYDAGETPQFSAAPLIHISPKSMTLKSQETQTVRLLIRKPETLEPGEYRAHVKVRLVDDNVDAKTEEEKKDVAIQVKANLVIIVPVIIRHGETDMAIKIEEAKLVSTPGQPPSVNLFLTREGNRSSMGDIAVSCGAQIIKSFPGISVYRPTARRLVSVPLDELPSGVDPATCDLNVSYNAQETEGGKKMAEAPVSK